MSNILNKSICNYLAGNPNNEAVQIPSILDIGLRYKDAEGKYTDEYISLLKNTPHYTVASVSNEDPNSEDNIDIESCAANFVFRIDKSNIIDGFTENSNFDFVCTLLDNSKNSLLELSHPDFTSNVMNVFRALVNDSSSVAYMLITWKIVVNNTQGTEGQWRTSYELYESSVNAELRTIIGKEGN